MYARIGDKMDFGYTSEHGGGDCSGHDSSESEDWDYGDETDSDAGVDEGPAASPPALDPELIDEIRAGIPVGSRSCCLCGLTIAANSRAAVVCTSGCRTTFHGACIAIYGGVYGSRCAICRDNTTFITILPAVYEVRD